MYSWKTGFIGIFFTVAGLISAVAQAIPPATVPAPAKNVTQLIHPVAAESSSNVFGPGEPSVQAELFSVPSGKCFMIEHVSARALGAGKLNVRYLEILAIDPLTGSGTNTPIGVFQTSTSTVPEHFVSKAVRIYAPPNTTVIASSTISPYNSNGTVNFLAHGQLFDCEP